MIIRRHQTWETEKTPSASLGIQKALNIAKDANTRKNKWNASDIKCIELIKNSNEGQMTHKDQRKAKYTNSEIWDTTRNCMTVTTQFRQKGAGL